MTNRSSAVAAMLSAIAVFASAQATGSRLAQTDAELFRRWVQGEYDAPAQALVDTAWVRRYDGPAHGGDAATLIALDSAGNVYVAGGSTGVGTGLDFVVIKYYPNGDTAWVRRRDFGGDDSPSGLAVDAQGNVYVTGNGGGRIATVAYNAAGQLLWSLPYGRRDSVAVRGLSLDAEGNLLMCGGVLNRLYFDVLVLKYRPNGDTAWVRSYNPTDSVASAEALAVNQTGEVYLVGSYLDSIPREQCLTMKCDGTGRLLWAIPFVGPARHEWLDCVALDRVGSVVAVGKSIGQTTGYDYLTIKYSPDGETLWTRRYNGPANGWDEARAVAVLGDGAACVTGFSRKTGYVNEFATVCYGSDGAV
ncbi:hypothetical protein FJY69_03915, partial [candidate division WOR-3 bacterium]|nr:hypothetical protein [candidate division WOR-3 bacterium]